jgi:predicted negative regulator of RcsB-dependent stress response
MSFSKTVSVCAALASIFAAGAAGWKLANENQTKPAEEVNQKYEQHITELQQKISELEQKTINSVVIPQHQQTQTLPPLPPVPEPKPGEFE